MSTPGEYLFETGSDNIYECLSEMSIDNIQDCSEYQVFRRGQEYYEDGLVEEILYQKTRNIVTAEVKGTYRYHLEFSLSEGFLHATCDCPYDDVCKHMVATLLSILFKGLEQTTAAGEIAASPEEIRVTALKYLKSLPKSKLVNLVMEFASDEFFAEVNNRENTGIDADALFSKIKVSIGRLFKDEELLYDPASMEDGLMKQLRRLKGLEDRISSEIGGLLLWIIRLVDDALNEGYLYVDNWYEDYMFESEDFCEYLIHYVHQLSFEEKISYISKLDHELNSMSYDTFFTIEHSYPRFFNQREVRALKQFITSHTDLSDTIVSRLYEFLEPELSDQEQETILRRFLNKDERFASTLVRLLFDQGRYSETLDLLHEQFLNRLHYCDPDIMILFLDVERILGHDMKIAAAKALEMSPGLTVLNKIRDLTGSVDRENLDQVKRKNPKDLLEYLESEQMFHDALSLVNDPQVLSEEVQFAFFRKHLKRFPEETEAFLVKRIQLNLNSTGNRYYAAIAESLDLMSRVNPGRTSAIAEEIRTHFKRRRNLLQAIHRF